MTTVHKLSMILLKYAPVIAGTLMLIHTIGLLFGINFLIVENLVALPIIPAFVCNIWSIAFKFCSLHRAYIWYTCLVTYCINYQTDMYGFGLALFGARIIVVCIGISLVIWFLIKHYNKYVKVKIN